MKTARSSSPWSWLLFLTPFLALPLSSGCMLLTAPEPEPTPTPVPDPTGVIFRTGDANPSGIELNKANDATLPEFYRLARVESAEIVWLQGYRAGKAFRAPNVFHLAGIVAPPAGAPGWQSSVSTLTNWASGQDLSLHLDPQFPYDLKNRQVVNIVFKGRKGGKYADQPMSLNRMMVRSGYALVDLYSPTSFNVRDWLKDEAFARGGLTGDKPQGLWQIPGIFQKLQQRRPVAPKGTKPGGSKVTVTQNTGQVPPGPPSPEAPPKAPPPEATPAP